MAENKVAVTDSSKKSSEDLFVEENLKSSEVKNENFSKSDDNSFFSRLFSFFGVSSGFPFVFSSIYGDHSPSIRSYSRKNAYDLAEKNAKVFSDPKTYEQKALVDKIKQSYISYNIFLNKDEKYSKCSEGKDTYCKKDSVSKKDVDEFFNALSSYEVQLCFHVCIVDNLGFEKYINYVNMSDYPSESWDYISGLDNDCLPSCIFAKIFLSDAQN